MGKKTLSNDGYLLSWTAEEQGGTGAKEAIKAFVESVTTKGNGTFVEVPDRIAVFDNDGTLWSEKPDYVQSAFARYRQTENISPHNETIEEYRVAVNDWLSWATNDLKGCLHTDLIYQPMLELLDYLRVHEFKTYIISGGGIEFVRPWSEEEYGAPPEQVVGSSVMTEYQEDPPAVIRLPDRHPGGPDGERRYRETVFMDDKEGKVIGINTHIGRRPIAAFGNSDGDRAMLEWTTAGPGPRFGLLIHHTDEAREFLYDFPSDQGQLSPKTRLLAKAKCWTVVDMARDWSHVSPPLAKE